MLPNLGRWSVSSGSVRTTYTDEVMNYGVHIELSRAVFEPSLKSTEHQPHIVWQPMVCIHNLSRHFRTRSWFWSLKGSLLFSSKCADNQSPTPQPVGRYEEGSDTEYININQS